VATLRDGPLGRNKRRVVTWPGLVHVMFDATRMGKAGQRALVCSGRTGRSRSQWRFTFKVALYPRSHPPPAPSAHLSEHFTTTTGHWRDTLSNQSAVNPPRDTLSRPRVTVTAAAATAKCQNLNFYTFCSLLRSSFQSMSTRAASNKELIMRRVAGRHPSHAQNTSSISPSSTHSDTAARFLHERWEYTLYVYALADALAPLKRRARDDVL
jgi:hypothetical protein